jgi:hypothetical protein
MEIKYKTEPRIYSYKVKGIFEDIEISRTEKTEEVRVIIGGKIAYLSMDRLDELLKAVEVIRNVP